MRSRLVVTALGVLVAGLLLAAMAGGRLAQWQPDRAGAQQATLALGGVPGSVSAGGAPFTVQVLVQDVADLAAYEWQISYDPSRVELTDPRTDAVANGPFLGSTGRSVNCFGPVLPPNIAVGRVAYGCLSTPSFGGPPGAAGGGTLSTVRFKVVSSGSVSIGIVCGNLVDRDEHDIPVTNLRPCITAVTPTATATLRPGETPQPTATTAPGQPTATRGPAQPTATTAPAGPTATPVTLPTPLPGPREPVELVAGCNLRAFMPQYAAGTQLITIVADLTGGSPRLWFQVPSSTAFDLFDFRSVERSTKTVLGPADEAGFICLDTGATWNRPVIG